MKRECEGSRAGSSGRGDNWCIMTARAPALVCTHDGHKAGAEAISLEADVQPNIQCNLTGCACLIGSSKKIGDSQRLDRRYAGNLARSVFRTRVGWIGVKPGQHAVPPPLAMVRRSAPRQYYLSLLARQETRQPWTWATGTAPGPAPATCRLDAPQSNFMKIWPELVQT